MLVTIFVLLITCFILGAISYQDIKDREVSLYLFLISFVGLLILHSINSNAIQLLISIGINMSIVLMLIGILYGFSLFVFKKSFFKMIGLGDLFMFSCLAIAFPTITFLILLSFSLFFAFCLFIFFKVKTVPLAGLQSLFLLLVLVFNSAFNFTNLYLI